MNGIIKRIFSASLIIISITFHLFALPDTILHEGISTWYYDENTTQPACGYSWPPAGSFYCAMNSYYLHNNGSDSSLDCGAFIQVTSDEGQIICQIIDECPYPEDWACWDKEQIDVSAAAFCALVQDTSVGILPVKWRFVPGTFSTPIKYHFNNGGNEWWMAVQIRDHNHAIKSIELKKDGNWTAGTRTGYNYFVFQSDESMYGTLEFRVTATTGESLEDTNIPYNEDMLGKDANGTSNFTVTDITKHGLFTKALTSKSCIKLYNNLTPVEKSKLQNAKRINVFSINGRLVKSVNPIEMNKLLKFSRGMYIVQPLVK